MKNLDTEYITERAARLAFVYLTRRSDLIVSPAPAERQVDFLVRITSEPAGTEQMFGVETVGQRALGKAVHEPSGAWVFTREAGAGADDEPIPVCRFLFVMDGDRGFYRWLKEPVVADGQPALRVYAGGAFQELDNGALDAIVGQVTAWYAAGANPKVEALLEETQRDPRSVLLLLTAKLEEQVHGQLQQAGLEQIQHPLPLLQAVDAGVQRGLFPSTILTPFRDLWQLRNNVVHQGAREISPVDALTMVSLGTGLLQVLATQHQPV